MEKEQIKQIERINKKKRPGTHAIIEHKTKCTRDNIKAVMRFRHFNEKIVSMAEKVNAMSDDEFAVAVMRAQKAIREKQSKIIA